MGFWTWTKDGDEDWNELSSGQDFPRILRLDRTQF